MTFTKSPRSPANWRLSEFRHNLLMAPVRVATTGLVLMLIACVGSNLPADAAPIGASSGSGPSVTSSFNLAGTGWVIDDGSFPTSLPGLQEVAYDPMAGPWHKRLLGGGGGEFAASDTGTGALMVFSATEYITIGGTVPWTDWHESIMQPGWRWLDDRAGSGEPSFTFSSGAPIPGLGITFTGPTTSMGGKIDFKFAPLPTGTKLKITKRLIFEGLDPLLPGDMFLGTLDIFEYPTVPEPTAFALLVVGMTVVASRCRRRRSGDADHRAHGAHSG